MSCPRCAHCADLNDREELIPDPHFWVTATAVAEMIQGQDLTVDLPERNGASVEWESEASNEEGMDDDVIYAVIQPEPQIWDDGQSHIAFDEDLYVERYPQWFRVSIERVDPPEWAKSKGG